jgi:hypothetical protein
MESRELIIVYRWELGSKSRLGQDDDVIEGQGIVEDVTFHNSDRGIARAGTWHDEERDMKVWQAKDEDREVGNQR